MRLVLVPFFIYIFILILPYFGPVRFSMGYEFFYLVIIFYAGVFFSYYVFMLSPKKRYCQFEINIPDCREFVFPVLFGTILFVLIYVYDMIFYYKVLEHGVFQARELATLEGPRGSFIGMIIFLLGGFPALLLALSYYEYRRKTLPNFTTILLALFGLLGLISHLLSGGRNAFILSILFFVVFFYLINDKSYFRKIIRRWGLLIFCVGSILFFMMLQVFVSRAELFGFTMKDFALNLERDFGVSLIQLDFLGDYYYAFLYFIMYLIHQVVVVFPYIQDGLIRTGEFCGFVSYAYVYRFVDLFLGTDYSGYFYDKLIIPTVYFSLPGSAFMDFGIFGVFFTGVVFSFFMFYFLSKSNSFFFLNKSIGSLLFLSLITAPVYNIFSYHGVQILFSIFIVYFFVLFIRMVKKYAL